MWEYYAYNVYCCNIGQIEGRLQDVVNSEGVNVRAIMIRVSTIVCPSSTQFSSESVSCGVLPHRFNCLALPFQMPKCPNLPESFLPLLKYGINTFIILPQRWIVEGRQPF